MVISFSEIRAFALAELEPLYINLAIADFIVERGCPAYS